MAITNTYPALPRLKPHPALKGVSATRFRAQQERQRIALLSKDAKTELLSKALIEAVKSRGRFATQDGEQAGLTPNEVERLFPAALEIARARYPQIVNAVAT